MRLDLTNQIGFLAEGDVTALSVISADIRYQIGEILIVKPPEEHIMYLFRVMNYENILRSVQDLSSVATNFLKNRQAYIARVETEKYVKLHGFLMGYCELNESGEWIFKKPRTLPPHFSEVYRGSDNPETLSILLAKEIGRDIEIGKLLIGTQTMDIPIKLNRESLPMHIQVAGTTGAGKSFFMMTFITSALKHNLKQYVENGDLNNRVSIFMVDVHDEYMKGVKHDDRLWGIYNIANTTVTNDSAYYDILFGEKFYLVSNMKGVPLEMHQFAKTPRFRYEDLSITDITSVMSLSDNMLGFMSSIASQYDDWIGAIEETDEDDKYPKGTVNAVQRRLAPITRSTVFADHACSDLAEIVYNLEKGHFYNFSSALLSSSQQFLVLTMLARTIFACRQALMSSNTWSDFDSQLSNRLPKRIANELLGKVPNPYNLRDIYTTTTQGGETLLKHISDLPVIMLTIEEAPSLLGSHMSKEGNVFIDISRQGRKYGIGLMLITQNISAMEPLILANTNTEINMMLGNDAEIRMAIMNASNNIAGYEQEFKVLSRGEAIVTNSLANVPLPVKVSNVPLYIKEELEFFGNPYGKLNKKKPKKMVEEDALL